MAITFAQLVGNIQLTTSAVSYFTATSRKTQVLKATAFNTDNSDSRTISVWIVPSGGSATDSNKIVEAKGIPSNGTVILSELEGHIIPSDASLYASASAATSISLTVSGIDIT